MPTFSLSLSPAPSLRVGSVSRRFSLQITQTTRYQLGSDLPVVWLLIGLCGVFQYNLTLVMVILCGNRILHRVVCNATTGERSDTSLTSQNP